MSETGVIGDRWADGGYAHWFGVAWGKIPAGIACGDDDVHVHPRIYSSWLMIRCWLAVTVFKFSSRACTHSLHIRVHIYNVYREDTITTHVIV